MKLLELTLNSGDKITFLVNGTFSVRADEFGTKVQDGTHNNGGWPVQESYQEVIKKLKEL